MSLGILRPRKRRRVTPIGSGIHVDAAVNPQRYDPDLAVLDAGAKLVSKGRLARGYGAPPIVAYGQALLERTLVPALNLRQRITQFVPALQALPKLREYIYTRV